MYDNRLPPVPDPIDSPKQSKLGITSLILGIIGLLIFCTGILISVGYGVSIGLNTPYATDPYAIVDQSSPILLISSGFMYCSPVFSLVGLGLGIAAVAQKNVKKTLGIVGLVINALILLGACGLFLMGVLIMTSAL